MRRSLRTSALAAILLGPAVVAPAKETPAEKPFVEKVEVRVRSVLVFVTAANGKPLAAAPRPDQLRASENGAPVEILAIEPIAGTKAATEAAAAPAAPAPPEAAPKIAGVPQYLYLDTTALNQRSMPIVTRAVADNLDSFLANGPMEIVGADPEPRVLLPATRDRAQIGAVLQRLPKEMPGKERLLWLRRDTMESIRDAQDRRTSAAETLRAHVQMAVREEVALVRNSLERLEAWAAARPDDRPGVLYYCNDGFDVDPTEIYLMAIPREDQRTRLELMQLAGEFGGEVSKLLARAEGTLAGKGLTTVPFALGSTMAEFAGNSANLDKRGGAALRRPTEGAPLFFYARPLESLGLVADATGGEVVSATTRLPKVVERVGGAFLLTFRVRAASDGKPHPFAVTAASGDLRIRAPKYLLTGSPESASIHRAMRALEGTDRARDLPLTVSLSPTGASEKGRFGGMLRIGASFSGLAEVIQEGAPLRLRLAVAVAVKNAPPFTTSQEIEWTPESMSWLYQVPLTWPVGAERVAVVVEEVSTGLAGSSVVDVPKPH